jgi:hypothetical protein
MFGASLMGLRTTSVMRRARMWIHVRESSARGEREVSDAPALTFTRFAD